MSIIDFMIRTIMLIALITFFLGTIVVIRLSSIGKSLDKELTSKDYIGELHMDINEDD